MKVFCQFKVAKSWAELSRPKTLVLRGNAQFETHALSNGDMSGRAAAAAAAAASSNLPKKRC
jgi:hypothetical protein